MARSLMMEVRNDLDFVEERYQEIDQKNISLDQCIEKNKQDFLALSTLISEIDRRFDESIIQSPLTVKLLDGAKETREQCQEELKEQRNPYEVSAYIQKLSEEVHVVQKSYERDEESRASYIQTISRLEDHMKQLTSKKVTVT